jgi:hypothetical protein
MCLNQESEIQGSSSLADTIVRLHGLNVLLLGLDVL